MKIAIPAFHTKVSPRFDTSREFILVRISAGHVIEKTRLAVKSGSISERIKELIEWEIDTLICGGIDRWSMRQLIFNHIEVVSWVTGEVEDAVTCFLRNELNSRVILGNNGKREGRWRFRRRDYSCNAFRKDGNLKAKEVTIMPAGDGTGPQGQGPGTGQGRGRCKSNKGSGGSGRGRGNRQGKSQGGRGNSGRGRGMRSQSTGQNR